MLGVSRAYCTLSKSSASFLVAFAIRPLDKGLLHPPHSTFHLPFSSCLSKGELFQIAPHILLMNRSGLPFSIPLAGFSLRTPVDKSRSLHQCASGKGGINRLSSLVSCFFSIDRVLLMGFLPHIFSSIFGRLTFFVFKSGRLLMGGFLAWLCITARNGVSPNARNLSTYSRRRRPVRPYVWSSTLRKGFSSPSQARFRRLTSLRAVFNRPGVMQDASRKRCTMCACIYVRASSSGSRLAALSSALNKWIGLSFDIVQRVGQVTNSSTRRH